MNTYIYLYFGTGIIVYAALLIISKKLFHETKSDNAIGFKWLLVPELLLVGIILWPLMTLGTLVCLGLDYIHISSKRKDKEAEASKPITPYSHLSTEELLSAQREILKELDKEKRNKHNTTEIFQRPNL